MAEVSSKLPFPKQTLKAILIGGVVLVVGAAVLAALGKRRRVVYDADPATGEPTGKPKQVIVMQWFGRAKDYTA